MSSIEVRPFRRSDRDQLTDLVNAHAEAVVPGMSVSVNAVLRQLERDPGEFIVDPWVSERATLVAEQEHRITAAAHLLRYFADERAGESYRGSGEVRWLVFWPLAPAGNPYWPDPRLGAEELIAACVRQLDGWGVSWQSADGALPADGVYGVPEQWPHIRALYQRAGFTHTGDTEIVYLARIEDLRRTAEPVAGLALRRSVGINGTRLSAVLGTDVIGYIEVETLAAGERMPRHGGWADIGNLLVTEQHRRRGVATWLLGQAAEWLDLGQVARLLAYTSLEDSGDAGHRAFLAAAGFRELTRTQRGWTRAPAGLPAATAAAHNPNHAAPRSEPIQSDRI
jgi:GNAT superfamily N-acetyltransferase